MSSAWKNSDPAARASAPRTPLAAPASRRLLATAIAVLATGGALFAQTAGTAPAPAGAPASGSGAPSPLRNAAQVARGAAEETLKAAGTANFESSTLQQIVERAFDLRGESFDPENGTLTWKGHRYDVGQFRVFRGRFERYLAQPATSTDDEVYRALLGEISGLLSTRHGGDPQAAVAQAWQLLYRAADFETDGGACVGIANQVFNAWRIRDEREALRVASNELERLRRQQQGSVAYVGDVIAGEAEIAAATAAMRAAASGPRVVSATEGASGNNGGGGNRTTTTTQPMTTTGSLPGAGLGNVPAGGPASQLFRIRELAGTEAQLQALAASSVLTSAQAKLQFQSQLLTLFLQRRFQHCLIAASFYRHIFRGSAQTLEVGKQELASFLPSTDLAITVEMIESLAREAMNEVDGSMQAVRTLYDDGKLVGALERLQETFFLGEYVPTVGQLEREKKQRLLAVYQKLDEARKLADLRDYEAVEHLVGEMATVARDFRSSEVLAAVRAAQRMSSLSLHAAQQSAAVGSYAKAQEQVQRAAELWPLNPAIKTYADNMARQVDLGSQAALFFDESFTRGDLRRIYDRRAELGVALLSDPQRGPQLKDAIDRMSRIEVHLAQADELTAQHNAFAAWEALVHATPFAPDDVVLNQRKAALAPRVAEFVGRLDTAQREADAGRPAAGLTHYLAAQALYPASQVARTGIEQTTTALLDALAARGPDLEIEAAPAATPTPASSSRAPDSTSTSRTPGH